MNKKSKGQSKTEAVMVWISIEISPKLRLDLGESLKIFGFRYFLLKKAER